MSTLTVHPRSVPTLNIGAILTRPNVHIVRGREAIVRMKGVLVQLSMRCDQAEVVDDLEYFLDQPKFKSKRPCLVLVSRTDSDAALTQSEDILGAVLLYEYQFLGIGSRVFVADYHGADRTVISPVEIRREVAFAAGAELLRRGALIAQLSFITDRDVAANTEPDATPPAGGKRRWRWAAKARTMPGYLNLEQSLEATLSTLGKHTRRNLRLYRRRAEADLNYEFIASKSMIGRDEFLEMNRMCPYPAPDEIAAWRYDTLSELENGLLIGLRARDGGWLSMLGGRMHRESMAIEWQMNRPDLPSNSLCTVMRSHLIEHAVEQGMKRINFVGGTTHTLKHSLINNEGVDLMGLQFPLPSFLLRWVEPLGRRTALASMVANLTK